MATIPVATAMAYLAAGLSCLPAAKAKKRPAIGGWKTWQSRLPTKVEVKAWFSNPHDAICVVSGKVSGNLECMDFDQHGELFAAWMDKIDTELLSKLVIEQTPSGGYHVFYRVDGGTGNGEQGTGVIDGNLKLARGIREGKEKTLIETRGEGGLFLCAPTEGYSLQQGDFANLAVIPPDARKALLEAARSLDELPAANCPPAPAGGDTGGFRAVCGEARDNDRWEQFPGDDYNERGDFRALLKYYGWQYVRTRPDGNEDWTRPGKDPKSGISATLKDGCFYVFSSNAAPFEPQIKYSPFAIYATLCHHGDFTAAAGDLARQGFGKARYVANEVTFNLNGEKVTVAMPENPAMRKKRRTLEELDEEFPELHKPLIHGLLREGETMNVIAAPKTGKSWLVMNLALAIALGRDWMGFPCEQGKVLIIDNELHPNTTAYRFRSMLAKLGIPRSAVNPFLHIENQRGMLETIQSLSAQIEELKKEDYKLIIIDAFYRAVPQGTNENDNGSITALYNLLDRYAGTLNSAFALIHHTSKGNQSQKSVTDVGAGAGAQSRAADTHLVLRPHTEKGVIAVDCAVRSFAPIRPFCLRFDWPVWYRDDDLNPEDLEGKAEARPHRKTAEEIVDEIEALALKLPELVEPDNLRPTKLFVVEIMKRYGCSRDTARDALSRALADGTLLAERRKNMPVALRGAKFVVTPELSESDCLEEVDDGSAE